MVLDKDEHSNRSCVVILVGDEYSDRSCVVVLVGANCSNSTCTDWPDLFLHNCGSDDRNPCQAASCVIYYQPGYLDVSLPTFDGLYYAAACCFTDFTAQKGKVVCVSFFSVLIEI